MTKKIALWTTILLLVSIAVYFSIYFFLTPSKNLQGIYLVPQDAIYIIETDEPIKSWEKVSSSEMWQHLQGNEFFAELTESMNSLDTLIKDNKGWLDLVGSRQVLISAHMIKPDDYDFLYLVDLQKVSKLTPLKSYIESLTTRDYRTTFREFYEQEIIEITDLKSRETLYLSFLNNMLAVSYTHTLVEAAIKEMSAPVIGRDLQFLEVSKSVDYSSLLRIYLNYKYLDSYLALYSTDDEGYIKSISEALKYTALSAELSNEGNISMKGFTSVDAKANPYVKAMLRSGNGEHEIIDIAPQRTAFYMGLGFDSFREFVENMEAAYESDSLAYNAYMQNMDKLERFLDINVQENFFDWIDDEIAFIQTQPGKLGKENEFLVVLKAKDSDDAEDNLDFITTQIRKKTPVKFRKLDYRGYEIRYLSVKGFFKLLLGKFFSKLEKPYFTVIQDYVVFSNHPQTLKSFIDDYIEDRTLGKDKASVQFINQLKGKSNFLAYIRTPVLYENLTSIANKDTKNNLNKHKDYIVCFSDIAFQISNDDGLFLSQIEVKFQNPNDLKGMNEMLAATVKEFDLATMDSIMQLTILDKDDELDIEEISPDDLDAKKYEEYFENGNLKIEVSLKEGLKHGTYREYYENGSLKIKGRYRNDFMDGNWKIYDEQGNVKEKKRYRQGQEI